MADERINMTADEFFDRWSGWCSMTVSLKEAELLNTVFANILHTFEERGSPTHHRGIFGSNGATIFTSPDGWKEPN